MSHAGSFEEDTNLPKGLESWNKERELEEGSEKNKQVEKENLKACT